MAAMDSPSPRPSQGAQQAGDVDPAASSGARQSGAGEGAGEARPLASEAQRPAAVRHAYGDLLLRQLQGIEAWNRYRRDRQQVLFAPARSREQQRDAGRELEVLDRAHAALVGYLDTALATEFESPLPLESCPRAVLVHRQEWFVRSMTAALSQLGVLVVSVCDNGAEAVGVVIAEQPDLVLVEDLLPMVTGLGVLEQTKHFCPDTTVVAQVQTGNLVGDYLDAGARAAVTRQVAAHDLAAQMSELLPRG